jgi:hypothetical protein
MHNNGFYYEYNQYNQAHILWRPPKIMALYPTRNKRADTTQLTGV